MAATPLRRTGEKVNLCHSLLFLLIKESETFNLSKQNVARKAFSFPLVILHYLFSVPSTCFCTKKGKLYVTHSSLLSIFSYDQIGNWLLQLLCKSTYSFLSSFHLFALVQCFKIQADYWVIFFFFFSFFLVEKSYIVYLGSHEHGGGVTDADFDRVTEAHYEFLVSYLGRYTLFERTRDTCIHFFVGWNLVFMN